jgi:hypothetical protein
MNSFKEFKKVMKSFKEFKKVMNSFKDLKKHLKQKRYQLLFLHSI